MKKITPIKMQSRGAQTQLIHVQYDTQTETLDISAVKEIERC